ncbi:MAG: response regulator [Sedimentisphaerales bacterium]
MNNPIIKILLVEDNPPDALLLKETLRGITSTKFKLTHVKQLSEAVTQLGKSSFDVILLDLSLPDSFGLETVERASLMAPSLPIIVLTGLKDETIGIKAVHKGAQDYLIKGQTDKDLLIRVINHSIERKRIEKDLRNVCDDLEIKVKERTLTLEKTVDVLRSEILRRIEAEKKINADQKQLRSLTTELMLTEERERHNIATELHDSLGPILAFAKRELTFLQKSVPEKTAEALNAVSLNIGQAIKQIRDLIFELSPPALYTLGFEPAIEELAENFCQEQKLKVFFESSDEPKPLTDPVKILLYRSIRELLINIAKHAEAKTVQITLSKDRNSIKIIVEDDGKGFDSKPGDLTKGFGLFSVHERLAHIGGTLDIQSETGKGTKAILLVPLDIKKRAKK